ncbi:translation initiation factor IF-2 [Thraustotheca clavata]|uniref:Translation initiation factor IF-2 n=1 Tax=Thraustotheca clavata TaxID=74557 RepID=A0A1W0AAC6_9STRA|nr:translation initiation factor IF-2 [Thraustotheca clavata]
MLLRRFTGVSIRGFASKLKKPVVLPNYIRVRDLAKKLKVTSDEVVKQTCTKHYHKYSMTHNNVEYKFETLKQVIIPFDLASKVAAKYGALVVYDSVEPENVDKHQLPPGTNEMCQIRPPVIAVMGHVNHGKTTLMDTLRGTNVADYEVEGITQKIHVCSTDLNFETPATFLDTPGHFHFTRMRNNAASVADLVVLVVAADEGCLLQTEESIGCIENLGVPSIVCINKIDKVQPSAIEKVEKEIQSYVALKKSPILPISAANGTNLDKLKENILEILPQVNLMAYYGTKGGDAQGTALEIVASIGMGTVIRVMIFHGLLHPKDHFICGMIHGVVKTIRNSKGQVVPVASPGQVVDVTFKNVSRHRDAPLEFGFHVVTQARAEEIIEQRELNVDFQASIIPSDDDSVEDNQEPLPAKGFFGAPIVIKADTAGSLTSILDTVDEMPFIHTAHIGLGNITTKDIERGCTIFGFGVRVHARERKLAVQENINIIIRPTIHELLEEISTHEAQERAKEMNTEESQE